MTSCDDEGADDADDDDLGLGDQRGAARCLPGSALGPRCSSSSSLSSSSPWCRWWRTSRPRCRGLTCCWAAAAAAARRGR